MNKIKNTLSISTAFAFHCRDIDCFPLRKYSIKKTDKEEKYCQLSEDAQITDFGPVPRSCYPLVALLTLAEEEDREIYDIVSNTRTHSKPAGFRRLDALEHVLVLSRMAGCLFMCQLKDGSLQ